MNTPLELGIAAAKSGRKKEALEYLHEAIRNNPNDILALLWIAGLSDEPTQQERYLRRVLQIDPNNQSAQKGLNQLAQLQAPPQVIYSPPNLNTQNLRPQRLTSQKFNSQNINAQYADSTDTIALIIEIVFGFFGVMGIGWMYIGKFIIGTILFIGFLAIVGVEIAISIPTGGVCACVFLPINIVLASISGLRLRDYVRRTHIKGSILYPIIAAFITIFLCFIGWWLPYVTYAVQQFSN